MNYFILRNSRTGLFFNGTNFSEESANKAKQFSTVDATDVKRIWGVYTQICEITSQQLAKLEQSDDLERRSRTHFVEASKINHPSVRAQREGCATRLYRRATKLACEVYADLNAQIIS